MPPTRSNIIVPDFVITFGVIALLTTSLAPCLPSPALASASAVTTRDQGEYSKRRRRRRGQQPLSSSSSVSLKTKQQLRVDSSSWRKQQQQYESLRERWVEILARNKYEKVRSANRLEQRYYYEAELFTDALLGIDDDLENDSFDDSDDDDDDESIQNYCDTRCKCKRTPSLISREISIMWKTIVIASSGILIGFPLAAFVWRILTSSMIPPSLVSIVKATVVNYILQAQAIVHSMPYLIRHLNQVRIIPRPQSLLPFLLKVIRKCIIIEAWRHIWIQVYKLTRFVRRKMTLQNAKLAYLRICPAWIRRGIKSILQSSVQAQVHDVVGGLLTVSPLEYFAWSNNGDDNVGGNDDSCTDSSPSMVDEFIMDFSSVQQTILEDTVESIISEEMMDQVVGVGGVDAFEMGEVVESIVEDCLSEGLC